MPGNDPGCEGEQTQTDDRLSVAFRKGEFGSNRNRQERQAGGSAVLQFGLRSTSGRWEYSADGVYRERRRAGLGHGSVLHQRSSLPFARVRSVVGGLRLGNRREEVFLMSSKQMQDCRCRTRIVKIQFGPR